MKQTYKIILLTILFSTLTACGNKKHDPVLAGQCANSVDLASKTYDVTESSDTAGAAAMTKAYALITAAKFEQTLDNFSKCADKANQALGYIRQVKTEVKAEKK